MTLIVTQYTSNNETTCLQRLYATHGRIVKILNTGFAPLLYCVCLSLPQEAQRTSAWKWSLLTLQTLLRWEVGLWWRATGRAPLLNDDLCSVCISNCFFTGIGVNFCKATRLEPHFLKFKAFHAFEPAHFFVRNFFCLLRSCCLPQCNDLR